MRAIKGLLLAAGAACLLSATAQAGPTLDGIRQRGVVKCGLTNPNPAFGFVDTDGVWKGFNVDLCRAFAAALFGDPKKAEPQSTTTAVRLTALQTGELDVLAANTTETLTRDAQTGLAFGPTVFYDGQAIMVKKALGVKSVKELDGATICVAPGTTTELNLTDYFGTRGITFKAVVIENQAEIRRAYTEGRCDAMTDDRSVLGGSRFSYPNPDEHVLLPETLSKEPVTAVVKKGDDQWAAIVRWTINALIEAEEIGVTQANVEEMARSSKDVRVQRLLGVQPGMGKALGLDETWARSVIKAVGNYGEIFDRHLGPDTRMKLERGLNALWTKNGLLYAPPFR